MHKLFRNVGRWQTSSTNVYSTVLQELAVKAVVVGTVGT